MPHALARAPGYLAKSACDSPCKRTPPACPRTTSARNRCDNSRKQCRHPARDVDDRISRAALAACSCHSRTEFAPKPTIQPAARPSMRRPRRGPPETKSCSKPETGLGSARSLHSRYSRCRRRWPAIQQFPCPAPAQVVTRAGSPRDERSEPRGHRAETGWSGENERRL